MKLSIEVLNILLLLLPGLVSSQIFYSIRGIDDEVSTSKRVFDTVIFSFLSYLVVATFITWTPIMQVKATDEMLNYMFSDNIRLILYTFAAMISIPLIFGLVLNKDYIHKALRYLKITSKTSRPNTWSDVLLSEDRFIVVYLKDERRIRGYPSKFSSDSEEGYIYLFNPAWLNDSSVEGAPDYIEINAHGMLINRAEIDLIEFTLDQDEKLSNYKRK